MDGIENNNNNNNDNNINDQDMGDAFLERLQMIQQMQLEEEADDDDDPDLLPDDIPPAAAARRRIRRWNMRRMGLMERQHRHRRARLEMEREMLLFRRRRQQQEQQAQLLRENRHLHQRGVVLDLLEDASDDEMEIEDEDHLWGAVIGENPLPRRNVLDRAFVGAPRENENNNHNDNPNRENPIGFRANNPRADIDDDFDDIVMMANGGLEGRITALRAALESVPSGLFEMVQEGRVCSSVLSGWGRTEETSCQCIVQHCANHPEEAQYVSRQGRTPLHEACLRGACRHVIQALLEATNHRASKERDFQRNTPLHLLFVDYSSNQLNNRNLVWSPEDLAQVVGDLLAFNPLVIASGRNSDGDTPLHSACMAPETMVDPSSIVQLLQASPRTANSLNDKGQTPLRLHCQRRNASPEVAGLLLQENPNALIQLDHERGWAPIHAAAANANFELLRYLVEYFPESVKVQTSKRQTALHLLCQHHTHLSSVGPSPSLPQGNPTYEQDGNRNTQNNTNSIPNVVAAVEFLLRADSNAIRYQDSIDECTPLHLVCKTEGSRQVPLPVVKLLLGCNPAAAGIADKQEYLPLHHACEMGSSYYVIQALVEAYPDATRALTSKGDSALSLACKANKSTDTVKLLLEHSKSVLKKTNDYGFCPLHCVCRAQQPRMGIVQALIDACPETAMMETHAGETPFHLASSNTGCFVGVLQLVAQTQARLGGPMDAMESLYNQNNNNSSCSSNNDLFQDDNTRRIQKSVTANKMGNTPLHDACLRSTPFEQLEVIAKANPEYILVRNNAGYTPFQILCKNGRIDERIISTFAHLGGPEIFSVKDANGNTPLHSAMRKDVDVVSLRCLIRASPDALRCRTTYGDLPLHLACLRKCSCEVVQEVAIAACCGDNSLAVVPNLAGQTPIGIAMREYEIICQEANTASANYPTNHQPIFHVLSTLVKIVHYGPVKCQQQGTKDLSLLKACVVLHRQNIRLDPAFIRQVIHMYPEEVKLVDEEGNYPLHIEASIPIEKMSLLDGNSSGPSHRRMGILRILLEAYPTACSFRNKSNDFPLGLMIQAGRVWGHTIAVALRAFPPALHWYKGLDDRFIALLLEKASKECGADTLFQLLQSRPGLFDATLRGQESRN